ncbi:thermonuclease family protein [Maribacter polysaccharolyticus]|uniref:thermonuclease family protein n=1 Tax=Maribacter polysaccharolyticus TaxID=3020831 RepID=UPI00237F7FDC|nr:thermonuclease family protein [Maribacter polysaccharolyticus]MDE3742533.1 thermonuclease family protein [Maribacter polysaccharolyticus]
MGNKLIAFILLLTVLGCKKERQIKQDTYPFNFIANVIGIKDGDTIEVIYNQVPIVIRLEHIDCPEKKQPFGNKAKQFTSNFIFKQNARIVSQGKKDRWGRLIAVVYNEDGKNLNKAIVENGFGMHFKKYSSDLSYNKLEVEARNNERGMWRDKNIIEPWTYRKNK